jgi:hypothetical protein
VSQTVVFKHTYWSVISLSPRTENRGKSRKLFVFGAQRGYFEVVAKRRTFRNNSVVNKCVIIYNLIPAFMKMPYYFKITLLMPNQFEH